MAKLEKCLIKNLDQSGQDLTAHFNPTELSVTKSVPWQKHKSSKGDNPTLEFTDAEPKTLKVDLLFDTYEERADVYAKYISKLEKLTLIMDGDKKRPPTLLFQWGNKFPRFQGVIKNLVVKYTMFLEDGTPVRANATIDMMQAAKTTKAKDKDVPVDEYTTTSDGNEGRIDNVAAENNTTQRELAEANDIDNPRDIPPGTVLRV
jgi:hypothetical protein